MVFCLCINNYFAAKVRKNILSSKHFNIKNTKNNTYSFTTLQPLMINDVLHGLTLLVEERRVRYFVYGQRTVGAVAEFLVYHGVDIIGVMLF